MEQGTEEGFEGKVEGVGGAEGAGEGWAGGPSAPRPPAPHGPAFRLLPGADSSPVILHVPHSSRVVPDEVRRELLLDERALEEELDLITDTDTAGIAAVAAARSALTPWRFVNERSRLVVDPERFPDEREGMRSVGMGAVYTRTTGGAPLRPAGYDDGPLLARYFHPYAEAMTRAVADRLAATGRAVVIDVHSYPSRALPYELHGTGERPPICLGTDPFHTPDALVAAARKVFARFGGTALDTPFAGTYVPLRHYGRDRAVSALMVEIRRDLYTAEPGGPAGPGREALGEALAELVDGLADGPVDGSMDGPVDGRVGGGPEVTGR